MKEKFAKRYWPQMVLVLVFVLLQQFAWLIFPLIAFAALLLLSFIYVYGVKNLDELESIPIMLAAANILLFILPFGVSFFKLSIVYYPNLFLFLLIPYVLVIKALRKREEKQ